MKNCITNHWLSFYFVHTDWTSYSSPDLLGCDSV